MKTLWLLPLLALSLATRIKHRLASRSSLQAKSHAKMMNFLALNLHAAVLKFESHKKTVLQEQKSKAGVSTQKAGVSA